MIRYALLALLVVTACAARRTEEDPEDAEPQGDVEVVIEGNDAVSRRDLRAAARREVRSYLDRGRRLSDADDAAYSMELLLREEGFPHGSVTFGAESARLVFVVEEGPRAYVGEVSFDGVDPLEVPDLQRFFAFERSGVLGTGRPYFNRARIDSAIKDVERHYLLHGYLRIAIGEPTITWNEDKTGADVTVPVAKGRPYFVRAVEVTGAEDLPDLGMTDGPYYVRLPAEAASKVRRVYLDRGHQRVRVKAKAEVDHENHAATIRIEVTPGPPVRLRHVRFEGEDRTSERFLRRRLPIEETEIVFQRLLDKGIDNLWRTGLFSVVRARQQEVGADEVDLDIALKEVRARNVDFELGYGSYELARGAVRFNDRNLFGLGRRFVAQARGSVRSAGFDTRIVDPYLLGDKTELEVAASYLLREEPSFDRQAASAGVTVTRRLQGPYRVRTGYRYRIEEANNIQTPLTPDQQGEFLATAGFFASLRRDTRNNILLPTRGSLAEIATLWSSPALGADNDFLEVDVRVAQIVSVFDRGAIAIGFHFRTREVLDSSPTLPIQERLFLGGESTVRSFFESELGPSVMGEPQGGLTSSLASIEFRYPIWRGLHGAVFYDVGNISPRAFAWTGPPGHAVGLGVRYYFPIGPLRLDFGYNPGRRFAASEPWALHLAFGFSF